jgi:hypothetical protein
MKNILFIICALSLFAASLVSTAHAHDNNKDIGHQVEFNVDQGNDDTSDMPDPLCDIHAHSHIAAIDVIDTSYATQGAKYLIPSFNDVVSSLTYRLKRPPRA